MRAFVLEDNGNRISEFEKRFSERNWEYTIVTNIIEAKKALSKEPHDIMFLDHDLGGEVYVSVHNSNTGSELARWLSENRNIIQNNPTIIIHSLNTVGQKYMNDLLPEAHIIPYIWTKKIFDNRVISQQENNNVE